MSTRLAFTPLLLFLLASCGWSDAQVAETKRRGDLVCNAIERYRAHRGKIPTDLKQLQPEFLVEIPQPTTGKKEWTYEPYQKSQSYILAVAIRWQSEPLLQTHSAGGWSYDTK